ncbi:hypothetical protein AAC387_Pa10g2087 [Persea americana]
MPSRKINSSEDGMSSQEVSVSGVFAISSEVEAEAETKLDEGNIHEAESSLREGLPLNFEEARALLGRLEYQRGNIQAALQVFDGIDLQAAILRFQPSYSEKPSRRNRYRTESPKSHNHRAASLVLEAIYLKSLCLHKLGKSTEAAQECKNVLDAAEKIFPQGLPGVLVDNKLQEMVCKAVELLPELWKRAGRYSEAILAYRCALLSQWNLDAKYCARIQKEFALFLLYGGVEAGAPSLAAQIDDSFVPKISLCGQTYVLAQQFEEILPGIFPRCDRWNCLALCYSGAGQNETALNLLRKSLKPRERPNDLLALLLAAKICSEDCHLAFEGVAYARKAIAKAEGADEHLKGVGLRLLGVCLRKQAKVVSSGLERSVLLSEALKSLDEAISFERHNPDLFFELGVAYAEHRNTNAALRYAKQFIDATGGLMLKGWRLLALVLSAQQWYKEAEVVTDAALDETAKWEQGPLLKMKAKLKITQSLPMDAVEAYRLLLALVQAQRKSFGSFRHINPAANNQVSECEVWQCLATLYASLSHWNDAEICLEKARMLKQYCPATLNTEGIMHEARGRIQEALAAYSNALSLDLDHVHCKVSIGALLWKMGPKSLPSARSFLSDALKLEPTNSLAWFYLGMVHKDEGRITDASDCFQAAAMLDESGPIESFGSIFY